MGHSLPGSILLCLMPWLGHDVVVAQAEVQSDPGERSTLGWLGWAVDRPSPKARAEAAVKLAGMGDISLEDWLAAATQFGPGAEAPTPGTHPRKVDLRVDGQVEATDIEVYVSKGYDHGDPAPLIVALHGTGGAGRHEVRFWQGVAEATGGIIIGPSEAGPNNGYRGDEREREAVSESIRWARREFNIDETRIWMTGYSRGGHLTWDFALRSADLISGAIPQAGGPLFGSDPSSSPLRMLANLEEIPLHSFVGEHDQPTLHGNLALVAAYAKDNDLAGLVLETVAGAGHAIQNQGRRDWTDWTSRAQRDSWPTSIKRAAFRLKDAHRAWLRVTKFNSDVVAKFQPTVRAPRGKTLTQAQVRKQVLADAIKKTSLVEAERKDNGRFEVRTRGVASLTLLLREDWMPPKGKKLTIRINRKNQRVRVRRSKEVLLRSFVERFDRTFLPVAEASVTVRGR